MEGRNTSHFASKVNGTATVKDSDSSKCTFLTRKVDCLEEIDNFPSETLVSTLDSCGHSSLHVWREFPGAENNVAYISLPRIRSGCLNVQVTRISGANTTVGEADIFVVAFDPCQDRYFVLGSATGPSVASIQINEAGVLNASTRYYVKVDGKLGHDFTGSVSLSTNCPETSQEPLPQLLEENVAKSCSSWQCYCTVGTSSGAPCLPDIEHNLGVGYDPILGRPTQKVLPLRFGNNVNFFSYDGITYEVPENVECREVTETNESLQQSFWQDTLSYRKKQALLVAGLGRFRPPYFSHHAGYLHLKEYLIDKRQVMVESTLTRSLFECTLQLDEDTIRSSNFFSLKEDDLHRIGTHVVVRSTFGGQLKVESYAADCVLSYLSSSQLLSDVGFGFLSIGGGYSYESSCELIRKYSTYSRHVIGGDVDVLAPFTGGNTTAEHRVGKWLASIPSNPAPIFFFVESLSTVSEDILDPALLNQYLESRSEVEDYSTAFPYGTCGDSGDGNGGGNVCQPYTAGAQHCHSSIYLLVIVFILGVLKWW
jgi:hypothetical protein